MGGSSMCFNKEMMLHRLIDMSHPQVTLWSVIKDKACDKGKQSSCSLPVVWITWYCIRPPH